MFVNKNKIIWNQVPNMEVQVMFWVANVPQLIRSGS